MLKINWSVPITDKCTLDIPALESLSSWFSPFFTSLEVLFRYLLEPYRVYTVEFIQLKAFNWIVRAVSFLLLCDRNVVKFSSVTATLGPSEQKGTQSLHLICLAFFLIKKTNKQTIKTQNKNPSVQSCIRSIGQKKTRKYEPQNK